MSRFPVDLPPTMLKSTLYTNNFVGNVNVNGNITSVNIFAENIYGNLTSNTWSPGNVTNLTVTGNVTAGYFIGNGALLTGVTAATLPTTANIDITGNVTAPGNVIVAGQVNVTGNVTGEYFIGNGALLSGVTSTLPTRANIDITGNVIASNVLTQNLVVNSASISLGVSAGSNTNSVAIGTFAGRNNQSISAIAVGELAGTQSQGQQAISIGYGAGLDSQGVGSVAIGTGAGGDFQGGGAVAIGTSAGTFSQGELSVALGYNTGTTYLTANSVAIGAFAAANAANGSVVLNATGAYLRAVNDNSLSIAPVRGTSEITAPMMYNTSTKEVTYNTTGNVTADYFIGNGSLLTGINAATIPGTANIDIRGNVIGTYANVGQVITSNLTVTSTRIALGSQAGNSSQGLNAIAIGPQAATNSQGASSIAIGGEAGLNTQGTDAVAIGTDAGRNSQGTRAVAIGFESSMTNQGGNSVSIGTQSLVSGENGIAIGKDARSFTNAIVINATGNTQFSNGADTLTINPIRGNAATTSTMLMYDATTKEVTYNTSGNITATGIANVLDITAVQGNVGNTRFLGGNMTVSGQVNTLGNVVAPFFIGNGSQLTGIVAALPGVIAEDIVGNIIGDFANVVNVIAVGGNVGNTRFLGGNMAVSGQVNTLGNIVAPFFIGDGSQLTGVTSTGTALINGNSNVVVVPNGNILMAVTGVANAFSLSGNGLAIRGNIFNSDGQLYNVPASYVRYVRTTTQSMTAATSNVILTTAETTFGSDITADTATGVFTLAAGKTYRLRGYLGYCASAAATNFSSRWYNVTTAAFIGSSAQTESPSNANNNAVLAGTAEATITPSVTTRVVLQAGGGTAFTLGIAVSGTQGALYPWAEIEVVGGQAPLTGVSQISGNIGGVFFENANVFNYAGLLYNVPASYARYVRTATQSITASVTANVVLTSVETSFGTDIVGNTTTGIFTLAPGKTYRLRGYPGFYDPTTTASFLACRWFNITTASSIGSSAQMESTNNNYIGAGFGGTAEATITPSVTTQVVLQARAEQNGTIGKTQITSGVQSATFAWADIEVIAGQAPISSTSTSNIDIRGNIIGPYANVANVIAVQGNVGNTRFLGGNIAASGQVNVLGNVVAPFFIGNGSQLTGITSTLPGTANIDIRGNVIGTFSNVNTLNVTGNVVGNLEMIANTYVFRQPTTFFWNAPVFGSPNIAGNNFLTATVVGETGFYEGIYYGWQFTNGASQSYSTLNWTTGFDFRKDFRIDASMYIDAVGPGAADGMFLYIGGANIAPNMTTPDSVTNGALSVSYDTYPSSNATIRSNSALLNTASAKIFASTWLGTVITCETLGSRRFLSLYTGGGGILEVSADVTSWTPRGNILSVGGWSGATGFQNSYLNSIRLSYL